MPEGAVAVNIPMWNNSDENEIYILNRPHTYESIVTPPTCTEQGYTTHTCHCGDSYTDEYTDAHGHDYSSWSVSVPATSEQDGTLLRTCHICGAEEHMTYAYVLYGDTDLDGELTVFDAILLLQYLENTVTLDEKSLTTADMNQDSSVDSLDVPLLMQALVTHKTE